LGLAQLAPIVGALLDLDQVLLKTGYVRLHDAQAGDADRFGE
jgi:hypothetical protein